MPVTSYGLAGDRRPAAIPIGPQSIAELVSGFGQSDDLALIGLSGTYTYRDLSAGIDAAAAALVDLGLRSGDRLAVSAPSDSEIIIAFLAAQRLGLVWIGVNRNLAPAEKLFVLSDAEVRIVLASAEVAETLSDLPGATSCVRLGSPGEEWSRMVVDHAGDAPAWPTSDPFSIAAIGYSSGTTGRPKGVCHSQHSMMTFPAVGLHALADRFWQPDLRRSATIALTILNGMVFGPLSAFAGGGTYVCTERPDALCVAQTVERHGLECIATVPTTIYDFLHKPEIQSFDLSSLKAVGVGGAPVPDQLKADFERRFGFGVVEDYGMAESPCAVVRTLEKQPISGSIGRAYPHVEVAAVEKGNVLPGGVVGEICVRPVATGPWAGVYTAMLGYWRLPDETVEALRDGWLHTGDVGEVDEGSNVRIVGRIKDLILRGGANIYPAEIEEVLRGDLRIEDVVVVGVADQRLGEIPVAYLTLRDREADHSTLRVDLQQLCLARLARYKVPERWYVVAEMPRNAMLKVDKALLGALPAALLA